MAVSSVLEVTVKKEGYTSSVFFHEFDGDGEVLDKIRDIIKVIYKNLPINKFYKLRYELRTTLEKKPKTVVQQAEVG